MVLLWFPLFSFVFFWFHLVSMGEKQEKKENPRKRQTNQGKSEEAISP